MENYEIKQKNQELFAELAKYQKDSKEYRDIVAKIVKNNVGLVMFVAKKYFCSQEYPTINNDDLISEGFLGLLNAIKAFAPAKGTFATYAGLYIRGAIRYYLTQQRKREYHPSWEDDIPSKDGKRKLADVVASPVNVETDFVEKQEKQAQIALLKERVNQLPERQRDFLTARYLSGEGVLTDVALAEQFECTQQNISYMEKVGIANLRKMYGVKLNMPQEINMTEAEKIKTKAVLKDLILAELSPRKQKIMLCKFYSPTPKTDEQVAQEIESTESTVQSTVSQSCKKLCTLCDSVQNTKHLKSILEFGLADPQKEC